MEIIDNPHVIPVGLKNWAVCAGGRIIGMCSNKPDAEMLAVGLEAINTIAQQDEYIAGLEIRLGETCRKELNP